MAIVVIGFILARLPLFLLDFYRGLIDASQVTGYINTEMIITAVAGVVGVLIMAASSRSREAWSRHSSPCVAPDAVAPGTLRRLKGRLCDRDSSLQDQNAVPG